MMVFDYTITINVKSGNTSDEIMGALDPAIESIASKQSVAHIKVVHTEGPAVAANMVAAGVFTFSNEELCLLLAAIVAWSNPTPESTALLDKLSTASSAKTKAKLTRAYEAVSIGIPVSFTFSQEPPPDVTETVQ